LCRKVQSVLKQRRVMSVVQHNKTSRG